MQIGYKSKYCVQEFPCLFLQAPVNNSFQMQIHFINLVLRVVLADIVIIGIYWLLICGSTALVESMSYAWQRSLSDAYFWTFLFWAGCLFVGLFYSNSHLFHKIKNDYVWSLCSILPSLYIAISIIIASIHYPCFVG